MGSNPAEPTFLAKKNATAEKGLAPYLHHVTAEKWFGSGFPTLVRAGVHWLLILGVAQLISGVI